MRSLQEEQPAHPSFHTHLVRGGLVMLQPDPPLTRWVCEADWRVCGLQHHLPISDDPDMRCVPLFRFVDYSITERPLEDLSVRGLRVSSVQGSCWRMRASMRRHGNESGRVVPFRNSLAILSL